MLEKDFRKEFINSAKVNGFHVVDIPDEIKAILPLLPPELRIRIAKKIKKKPYDLGLCYKGKYIACELKFVDAFTFNLNHIETHQKENLREAKEAGCNSYVIVNFRKTLTTEQQLKFKNTSRVLNKAFAIPITLIEEWYRVRNYSISMKTLESEKNVIELDFNEEIEVWELKCLISR